MKRLISWFNIIIKKRRELKRWQRIVTVLAAVTTFVTTYALILPAITVERDNTENVGGMYLEQEEDQEDMLEENAPSFTGICIAADRENAVAFEYADDGMTATAVFSTEEEIPEGAELVVNPVDTESEEYADLSGRAIDLLDKEFIYDVTTCSFYDFALICDGVDVTPKTGLVDVQINFMNNTVEHFDDVVYAGRFGRPADLTDSRDISNVDDELVSSNPDESSVIEFNDGIITVLSLKGSDLALTDSAVGILAGNVDEEAKAAAAETNEGISDHNVTLEEDSLVNSAETEGEADQAVKTMEAAGDDYTVILTYDESSKIPDGAFLTASEISQDSKEYKTYLKETKKALGLTEEETLPRFAARFFDIKIMVGEEEFTPESGVSVEITYAEPLAEKTEAEVSAVHFADKKADAEVIEAFTTEIQDDGAATVEFTAESFSVYGVIYTVDFEYSVNGKMYQFSLPGGGFVSFTDLVEVLGIIGDTNSDENGSVSAENTEENAANKGTEENSVNSDTNTQLTLGDVEVSEATREFVADVASVEFSSPELVDVSKVENETTVGKIKDSRGLECEYSAELTEEQIAEINVQTVEAGDWALISVQPFTSEETLTATMKDGEVFTIRVTDAQIQKDYISASGETYTITITYSDEAGIPDGADLKVKEIEAGSTEYGKYLTDSAKELGVEDSEISFARFFDIAIVDENGKKIEPQTSVQVKIEYKDSIDTNGPVSIVHFADEETEIISDVDISEDGTILTYEQDSFSVTGTIQTGNPTNGGIYMVIVEYNGKHYMVNNDGTLSEITYGQDASGHPDNSKVSVEYPMFWTYYYQYGGHLRFASEASGFNADQTASGYYYKYIDPNSEEGIIEENKNGAGTNLLGSTVIAYHDNTISNAGYNKYIGVVNDGGVLRISGNVDASNAAKIELASPGNVLPSNPLKHSVNHIDIGIDGAADVTVPLAYGRYSYTDGNGNTQTFTVDRDHLRDVMLHAGKDEITVTSEDMKGAEIKAYLKTDYERYKDNPEELANHELNDVFYITGYSANDTTAFSEVQVRVEGSFKVAYGIDDANNNYYNRWWYQDYINQVKQQRLSHQVEYTVSLNKTITLPVTIDGHQLYDDQDQPLYVTVDIPLKDSFSYWDTENECPPVQWDWSNWQSGDIATHGMSGMDFRLDGGTVQVRANSVAINITKYIEDTEGNPIKVASNITNRFEIFRDVDGNPDTVKNNGSENVNYEDYLHYHYKDITISPGSDSNLVHDYQVTPGMYYIKEDESTIPEYITEYTGDSSEGQQWKYKSTEILTEYVWRGGADIGTDSKGRLEITHTNANGDQYVSIPDALGSYSVDGQGRALDNNGNYHDLYNGFLEFYVINKYEKVENIEEPEEGKLNIQLEKKWEENGQEIDAPSDNEASVQFKLHKIKKTTTKNGSSGGSSGGGTGGGTGTSTGEYTVNLYYANGGSPATSTSWDGTSAIPLSFIVKGGEHDAPSTNINYNQNNNGIYWFNINYNDYERVMVGSEYGWKYEKSITPNVSNANANKVISLYFTDEKFASANNFHSIPVLGSGGSTPSQPNVTTEESEEIVTLSNYNEWSYIFENLPARYENSEKIEEYSYYLEEISESQTGGAANYTKVEFKDAVGSSDSPIEGKDWYNKEDRTVTVTAINKKASLTVEKEWRGEEDTAAYPPIKFQLYQGWENGDVVSEGWLYTEATNNEVDSNGAYTIRAEDAWKIEFFNLPTTATHNGRTGKVGYYVVEVDPRDGTNWFTNPHVKKNYQNSNGNFDNAGNQPYNAGLAGNTGTLTIINTMPKYDSLEVQKKWYEIDNGSWADISENPTKTSDYAFGFMVQRQVEILGTDGVTVVQTIPYEDYGSEILVSQDKVLLNNNDFTVSYNGSLWLFKVEGNDDISRHENNLVGEGYYQKDDGSRAWAKFSYKFVEVDAYKLSSVQNGGEVAPRDQWETIACNPEYGMSGDGKRAIISNYPIGEMKVKKIWENDDPDLEIGNKVYFKVFQNGDDITPDIVAHPSKYGLFSNQIYDDPVNDDHDSVVIAYDGTDWETITIKGLNIFDRTHGDAQNQYSVQEIGYSDQKNQDFWDVSGFLKGYMIDDQTLNPAMDNQGKSTSVASDPVKTIYIKNEYVKKDTEIKFTKVWQNNLEQGISWQKPITVTLHQRKGTRDQAANGQGTDTGKTAEITLDPYGMGQNAPGSGSPGSAPSAPDKTFTFDGKTYEWSMEVTNEGAYYTFTIEGLPYRDNENYSATDNYLSYYVTESSLGTEFETKYKTGQESGGSGSTTVSLIEKPASDQTAKNGEYIFNIQKAGSLKITKSVTENGSTTLSDTAKEALAGTYTFTLYKDGDCTKPYQEAVEKQVEEGGATVTKTVMEDKTVTITIGSDGSSVTSPEITGLPAGDYWIKETDPENTAIKPVTNPVKVTVEADKTGNAAVVAEFTNNLKSTGIKIIKIDETTRDDDNPRKLGDAYFKLYQLTGVTETNDGTYTVYPDAEHCEEHTNSSGTLEFSSLPNGKYMVEETKSPDGYVKEQEVKFYFTVTDEGVDWTNEYGKNTIVFQDFVSYVPNTVTFTVGNTPGAALPNTGGPGTRLFTILGSILILGAGVLLWRRRRTI